MIDIFFIMQLAIIIVSLTTIILEIRKMRNLGFHVITLMVVLVCFYWAGYYIYQIVREILDISFLSHRVFVRSGILFSVVVFLAKAIRVNRRIK